MMKRLGAAAAALVMGVLVCGVAQAGPSAQSAATVELTWTTAYTNGAVGSPGVTFTPGQIPVFEYGVLGYKENLSWTVNIWREPSSFLYQAGGTSLATETWSHGGLSDGFSGTKGSARKSANSFTATATAFSATSAVDQYNMPNSQGKIFQKVTLPAWSKVTFTAKTGLSSTVDGMLSAEAGVNPVSYVYSSANLSTYTLGVDGKFRFSVGGNVTVMADPAATGVLVDKAYAASNAPLSRTVTNNSPTPLTFAIYADAYAFAQMNHDPVLAGARVAPMPSGRLSSVTGAADGAVAENVRAEVLGRRDAARRAAATQAKQEAGAQALQ